MDAHVEEVYEMNIASYFASQTGVEPQHLMLLRHSNTKLQALARAGASIEEFTLLQPTNSRYDYYAEGRDPIRCVVVIANDHVEAIYRILGIKSIGTTHSLASAAFLKYDQSQGYPELPAKLFAAQEVQMDRLMGQPVMGWTSPRTAVARYGGRLFQTVEAELA